MASVSSAKRHPSSGNAVGLRGGRGGMDLQGMGPEVKARLFLFVACLWPLWVMALYGASAPAVDVDSLNADVQTTRMMKLRNVLDRVDIMGYGPTHPRVAVVIVGDTRESLLQSVESVYRTTDMNRLFLICAVLDGHDDDSTLLTELEKIEKGSVPHWHGLRPEIHVGKTHEEHSKKIHVLFNSHKRGVAASRSDAADFIDLLQHKHESAGLKSPQEDLILLLLEGGTQLTDDKWLPAVTSSLIVPPPLIHAETDDDATENIAMKLANAVALRSQDHGERMAFDEHLQLVQEPVPAAHMQQSSGQSYLTPAWNGGGLALRLDTFLNFPAQDASLREAWAANLDVTMNLWLCGDGIDVVQEALVSQPLAPTKLNSDLAARFAAVWMEDKGVQKFLQWFSPRTKSLDWETKLTHARNSPTFPKKVQSRCRPFGWYMEEINTVLSKILSDEPPKRGEGEEDTSDESSSEDAQAVARKIFGAAKAGRQNGRQEEEHEAPPAQEQSSSSEDEDGRRKPTFPLRKTNLEIVQKAKPIDIKFVDVSGGHKEHPHLGANDEDGKIGYIHDEAALHRNPPTFHFDSDQKEHKACAPRDNNWKMMTKRVKVEWEYDKKIEESGVKRDKIFCLVYTTEKSHDKIPNIRDTWGSKCDGFMVGSTKTNTSLGTVEILHEGKEEYDNIWQKVRSMWSYIYDNYYDKYDWFHIGGDDLFMIVENFRYYLESEEIKTAANGGIYLPVGNETEQTPLLLGRRFAYMGDMNNIFDSGGSGYTMNKAALKTLVVNGFPNYFPHMHTFSEDTMVARVFRKMGVYPYDTKDDHGGERYMPFMPGHHWSYHLPKDPSKDWYAKYSIDIKEGPEHSSPQSIAFHYVKGDDMKRLYALAYALCSDEYK
mmetsp:Transcript_3485/g.7914  ORF Transcript_3485/g.7914 Transcript_3485/m.7914 type:complete len:884 (-) Transcript_3485:35-2686(-)